MTWSKGVTGNKDEAEEKLQADKDIPQAAKDEVLAVIELYPKATHFSISTSGAQSDTSYSHTLNINVS